MQESAGTYFVNMKNYYAIVENVPCWKCGQCGEAVFSTLVMEKIDELLARPEQIASKIFIVDYAAAA